MFCLAVYPIHFLLISRVYAHKLSEHFCLLFGSPELYDVVIVCEDGSELQCHKCILVARLGMLGTI